MGAKAMLFDEIFGSYYQAAALVLREAVKGTLTQNKLNELIQSEAFSESMLAIPQGLQGEKWRLLHRDLTTPIEQPPTMPITLLQKRWLKALLLDPRVQLFSPDTTGLEDVKPLFTPDMFVYYDQYADGDNYNDPDYITHFRTILRAIQEKRNLFLDYSSSRGRHMGIILTPHRLEYSEKDDRFRLIASNSARNWIINLAGIISCRIADREDLSQLHSRREASVVFELTDRRNAMERVLLHFSHLKKETEKLDDDRYRVTLHYDPQDETEMVIRILSFGPAIRVLEPRNFVDLVKQRIDRQMTFASFLPCGDADDLIQS